MEQWKAPWLDGVEQIVTQGIRNDIGLVGDDQESVEKKWRKTKVEKGAAVLHVTKFGSKLY